MTDSFLEDETRHLLAAATESLPAGGDHAGLAERVQRRVATRRVRRRVAMSAGALATAGAVAAGLLTGLVGPAAPSAYAAVVAAVTTTSSSSFDLTVSSTGMTAGGQVSRSTWHGEYDLARSVGAAFDGDVRWAGGYLYMAIPPKSRQHGKKWDKMRAPISLPIPGLWLIVPSDQQLRTTPQTLLAFIKATGNVRKTGTTVQGWTTYAFTRSHPGDRSDGTVTVDQHGLVRQLTLSYDGHSKGFSPAGQEIRLIRTEVDFARYGIPVSVPVPPDSECVIAH